MKSSTLVEATYKPHLLLLDHEDSFSATLESALVARGARVTRWLVERGRPRDGLAPLPPPCPAPGAIDGLVLSPGPGRPEDYPASLALLREVETGEHGAGLPVFGVCLGLQLCAVLEGARVERVPVEPVHGRRVECAWDVARTWVQGGRTHAFEARGDGPVVLFNSLGVPVSDTAFSDRYHVVAQAEACVLLAVHRHRPWILVQSHPESFASVEGMPLIAAFIRTCASPTQAAV